MLIGHCLESSMLTGRYTPPVGVDARSGSDVQAAVNFAK